jgi:hypothetical protein
MFKDVSPFKECEIPVFGALSTCSMVVLAPSLEKLTL